jgi:hypothetical protein
MNLRSWAADSFFKQDSLDYYTLGGAMEGRYTTRMNAIAGLGYDEDNDGAIGGSCPEGRIPVAVLLAIAERGCGAPGGDGLGETGDRVDSLQGVPVVSSEGLGADEESPRSPLLSRGTHSHREGFYGLRSRWCGRSRSSSDRDLAIGSTFTLTLTMFVLG